ncbi:MAG: hypothetical protein ACTSR5_12120, partial [Promethearchaeota archaeon]
VSSFSYGTLLISSMHFQDAYNMDIERTKRCIVHFGVAMPDGTVKELPFCTMNTLHRPDIEKQVAKAITQKVRDEFDLKSCQMAELKQRRKILMTDEIIETKDGLKVRKLAELNTSTAKDLEDAMLKRVEYFKEQNEKKSGFNSTLQNTFFKATRRWVRKT